MSIKAGRVIDICVLTGKIMLENGAENYRVEDTMKRIANACYDGAEVGNSFATPTGIFMTIEDEGIKLQEVTKRTLNLKKVTEANQISREIVNKEISLDEAYKKLVRLDTENNLYPVWIQFTAAFIVSGALMLLFGGVWSNFIVTAFIGGIGYLIFYYNDELLKIKFLAEVLASMAIAAMGIFAVKYSIVSTLNIVVTGAVMPLVPGVPIANAVRDLLAGHLISGMGRGVEAILSAASIAIGIAITYRFLLN
ncbi:threonine/serine exporter family protein [Brochothrix thermosphacta]|uniref:threonine/serine exporter family protein n=1 Tax=Brochothrix thermosphacta TaxID=2756 RepID=UPI002712EFB4|nr:threonine/serine exporter family protein [Brochothrix thermosphacta]MDO7864517.1 threonine/serine exporter family protein [Brochothrix thermosphacta]